MPPARNLNPNGSPLAFFGAEIRRLRTKADLTQDQLGERIHYSRDLVGAIETARKWPSADFLQRCDRVLEMDGLLVRLWDFLCSEVYPSWFRSWLEFERTAHTLRSWEPLVVPGLLQVEEYARALLREQPGLTREQVDELVAARMERQAVLDDEDPPLLWVVLDEGVLRRPIGTPETMRGQLHALVEASHRPNVTVQVVPLAAGAHPGVDGAFGIANFDGAQDVVYLDSVGKGQVIDRAEDVRATTNAYDAIRAEALPARASLDLIAKVMEQWS